MLSHTGSSNWNNILYHFNPRYTVKKKELVQCDMKDGSWGVTDRKPFTSYSVLPNGNFLLMIQIRADGFYTSINEMFFSFFKHRRDISDYRYFLFLIVNKFFICLFFFCRSLALQLPLTDDPGHPENALFHKV